MTRVLIAVGMRGQVGDCKPSQVCTNTLPCNTPHTTPPNPSPTQPLPQPTPPPPNPSPTQDLFNIVAVDDFNMGAMENKSLNIFNSRLVGRGLGAGVAGCCVHCGAQPSRRLGGPEGGRGVSTALIAQKPAPDQNNAKQRQATPSNAKQRQATPSNANQPPLHTPSPPTKRSWPPPSPPLTATTPASRGWWGTSTSTTGRGTGGGVGGGFWGVVVWLFVGRGGRRLPGGWEWTRDGALSASSPMIWEARSQNHTSYGERVGKEVVPRPAATHTSASSPQPSPMPLPPNRPPHLTLPNPPPPPPGKRVTCRDWFQLTLKEGLTVFRDQEFSSDMNSRWGGGVCLLGVLLSRVCVRGWEGGVRNAQQRLAGGSGLASLGFSVLELARTTRTICTPNQPTQPAKPTNRPPPPSAVKRIEDAMRLRSAQFSEDAGPMAHPIRPDSYIKMDNFYTVTVYEKVGGECGSLLAVGAVVLLGLLFSC